MDLEKHVVSRNYVKRMDLAENCVQRRALVLTVLILRLLLTYHQFFTMFVMYINSINILELCKNFVS